MAHEHHDHEHHDHPHEHEHELEACPDETAKLNRLCELNVIRQVRNISVNPITEAAWRQGQELTIHGWVYSLADGLVTDQEVSITGFPDRKRLFGV